MSNKIEKCKTTITPLVKKCMESKTCIDLNKNNPLFLDGASDALKGQPIVITKTYKENVQEGSVFSYKIVKKTFDKDTTGRYEYLVGQALNLLRGEINNFCYTFKAPLKDVKKSFLIEHVDGSTLSDEMKRDNIDDDHFDDEKREKYHSIFLQVFLALHIAFGRFGFVHNDLHTSNILITTFPTERWVDYPVRLINKTFRVKTKYFPTIIDYGLSQVIDEKGNVVMDQDFSIYDLQKKYCIPIRDWTKLFYSFPKIGKMLYGDDKKMAVIGVVDPILRPVLDTRYAILPAESKVQYLNPMIPSLYSLHNGDVVNALLNTFTERYPSKVIFRDCYFVDFYQRIPEFVLDRKSDLFSKTYVSLLSQNGDGFIDARGVVESRDISDIDTEIRTICDTLYEEMRDLLSSPYKGFRQTNDDILRIQEKMAMIPVKNRGKFNELDEAIQKHLKRVAESIIKF
jgi:hypothetical protein